MSDDAVLELIRRLGQREKGLLRTHRTHPALYARARRFFGSWASAVAAAGLDYRLAIHRARQQSLQTRRRRRLEQVRQRRARPPLPPA
jgi:hypothetical protein